MNKDEHRPTVMVVDDTPDNLRLLESVLREDGYRVQVFPRALLALSAAARNPPDLILLDINMPEMNGFEACERFKADPAIKDIPIIFISALSDASAKVRAFIAGGVDYVTKPFQFEEVTARVRTHLQLRDQKRALQQAHDKLRELEELRDGLVHMLVHDMRSPLSVMLSNLVFVQGTPLSEDASEALADSVQSTRVLVEMVSGVLDVSKMETSEMPLQRSPVDLAALVQAELDKFSAVRAHRTLTFDAPPDLAPFSCDAHLIGRVVQNLIGNALKFTNRNTGTIAASISRAGDGLRVLIQDNGPGLAPEDREKVFDKFFQVVAQREGRRNSTGLGLTFCKLAVEAHGGRIGVDSVLGQGSGFWFELQPVAQG